MDDETILTSKFELSEILINAAYHLENLSELISETEDCFSEILSKPTLQYSDLVTPVQTLDFLKQSIVDLSSLLRLLENNDREIDFSKIKMERTRALLTGANVVLDSSPGVVELF